MYKTSLQEYLLHYQNCKHVKNGNAILAASTLQEHFPPLTTWYSIFPITNVILHLPGSESSTKFESKTLPFHRTPNSIHTWNTSTKRITTSIHEPKHLITCPRDKHPPVKHSHKGWGTQASRHKLGQCGVPPQGYLFFDRPSVFPRHPVVLVCSTRTWRLQ
jgi:hypothetical protein